MLHIIIPLAFVLITVAILVFALVAVVVLELSFKLITVKELQIAFYFIVVLPLTIEDSSLSKEVLALTVLSPINELAYILVLVGVL
jgi:hypothetical protein